MYAVMLILNGFPWKWTEIILFLVFEIASKYCILDSFVDCDIEWFALETNRDHSVIFYIAPKDCISDSYFDYEGYSNSSKGFLPTVVDIMMMWIKFTHSGPF